MIAWLRALLRPYVVLRRCIVNLNSGTSFRAVVYAQHTPWLELRSVEIISDRGADLKGARPVDGAVLVSLSDIDFIQLLNG